MKNSQMSMSRTEMVLLIGYLLLGWFLLFAAEYHIGCWPGRSRTDVQMCSEYCYLGFDINPNEQSRYIHQQADPLVPCLPWE